MHPERLGQDVGVVDALDERGAVGEHAVAARPHALNRLEAVFKARGHLSDQRKRYDDAGTAICIVSPIDAIAAHRLDDRTRPTALRLPSLRR